MGPVGIKGPDFEKVGDAIKDAGKQVGQAIKNIAGKVGSAVMKFFGGTSKANSTDSMRASTKPAPNAEAKKTQPGESFASSAGSRVKEGASKRVEVDKGIFKRSEAEVTKDIGEEVEARSTGAGVTDKELKQITKEMREELPVASPMKDVLSDALTRINNNLGKATTDQQKLHKEIESLENLGGLFTKFSTGSMDPKEQAMFGDLSQASVKKLDNFRKEILEQAKKFEGESSSVKSDEASVDDPLKKGEELDEMLADLEGPAPKELSADDILKQLENEGYGKDK